MSDYELIPDVFVSVTPAGAYYAVGSAEDEPARRLLFGILAEPRTPALSVERLCEWSGESSADDALALLHRVQSVGWVSAESTARDVPGMRMEQDMPALLRQLSDRQRALLADPEGFQLANSGFTHEAAEQLAALAAELAAIHQRYRGLLRGNLRLNAGGLATVDAAGHSQLGLWPLSVRGQGFLLVIAGAPQLDRRAFADAVWGLAHRYAAAA